MGCSDSISSNVGGVGIFFCAEGQHPPQHPPHLLASLSSSARPLDSRRSTSTMATRGVSAARSAALRRLRSVKVWDDERWKCGTMRDRITM